MTIASSLVSGIGQLFHPLFEVVATVLAWIYGVVPNYAVAIGLLTVLVMAALTPLTVKSTKSMLAMQRLQPEMKKLQQKYKGPENRQLLNEEMMKLYKESGVNPASSCIPMFLQMPFFIVLYDTIRGLTNTVTAAGKSVCPNPVKIHGVFASPRYIPHTSSMFHHLCASGGNMPALGINLALKPTSYHATFLAALPYYALVAIACALQFVQMWQMNRRNPGAMQANPQMRNMQYFMPIIFAVIYVNVQSAVVIYMIVSTLARIVTQDMIFRTGIVEMPGQREISRGSGTKPSPKGADSGAPPRGLTGRLREALGAGAAANVVENGAAASDADDEVEVAEGDEAKASPAKPASGGKNPSASARPPSKRPADDGSQAKSGGGQKSNGAKGSSGSANGQASDGGAAKTQNRAKSKRTRKAR
jgi:YidC/Oxa1 family membrane protein insertase